MWEGLLARFSRRGVDVAETISELGFFGEDPGRHAQPHTNHKPVFAELAIMNRFLIGKYLVEYILRAL